MSPRNLLVRTAPEGLVPARIRVSRNPAAVYLASLAKGSQRTMTAALEVVARIISSGKMGAAELPWAELRYETLQAVKARLRERYSSAATVNKHLAAVKSVMREAWRLDQLSVEDLARIRDVKLLKPSDLLSGREVTPLELERIFSLGIQDGTGGARDTALLAVLYGTGLRRAELAALELRHLRRDGPLLLVYGKGGKPREVFIDGDALAALDQWLALRGAADGALFCPVLKSGKVVVRRMTPEAVHRALRRAALRSGVDAFTPHDLRRSYISHQLDAGTDIKTVRDLVGHADMNTTARYDRRGDGAKRKAALALRIPFRRGCQSDEINRG